MTPQEWRAAAQAATQQIAVGVDELTRLLSDPQAQAYMASLPAAQRSQIEALAAAVQALHAALSPSVRQMLGVY